MVGNTRNSGLEGGMLRPGLLILIVLQVLMLAALYTRTPPHPPLEVAPFALGPFISASVALAVAALAMPKSRGGFLVTILACLTALISYGPQKWFDPAIGSIWPAVLLAQLAIIAIVAEVAARYAGMRDRS